MKTLKEYINESLLDDDILDDEIVLVKAFLEENYKGDFIIKKLGNKYIVDSKKGVMVKNRDIISLTNGLFVFNYVDGYFDCAGCNSLKNLEGAPLEVGKSFYCHYCNSLKNLEGAPRVVSGDFYCSYCESLTSLDGAPKKVGGYFSCAACKSLISLNGVSQKIGGYFSCSYCSSLKNLQGAPRVVGGYFNCSNCGVRFTKEDVEKVCNVKKNIYV